MIVPDATRDERFARNPLVTAEPCVRFYAGAPLLTPDGCAVGTLCVLDRVARQLSASQADALRALSHQVVSQMELRRTRASLEESLRDAQGRERELRAFLTQVHGGRIWFHYPVRVALPGRSGPTNTPAINRPAVPLDSRCKRRAHSAYSCNSMSFRDAAEMSAASCQPFPDEAGLGTIGTSV